MRAPRLCIDCGQPVPPGRLRSTCDGCCNRLYGRDLTCTWCGAEFRCSASSLSRARKAGRTTFFCSKRCSGTHSAWTRNPGKIVPPEHFLAPVPFVHKPLALLGPDGRITKQFLGDRDGWDCCLCGQPMEAVPRFRFDPEQASFEHLTPRSQGGLDTLENLKLSHLRCNRRRGTKPFAVIMSVV